MSDESSGMRVDVISIFPDYLAALGISLVGKAIDRGDVQLHVHDLRDATDDSHRTVDDSPFGGGPGMVMKPEPWGKTLDGILAKGTANGRTPRLIIPTPSGQRFDQELAAQWAQDDWLIFACGRYEGIDARVAEHFSDQCEVVEVSIGDYVLAGGEAAVLVILEAVIRLLPGVLGNEQSAIDDSFAPGRTEAGLAALEGPVYTRPATWRGIEVPSVLLSGDHGAVAQWRVQQSTDRTAQRRPDLSDSTND